MSERRRLEQAIEHMESQRVTLGDAVVDSSIAALRRQLAALDAAAPEEQRKLVTVLFADLAGWTQMASAMDPEDVQAIQQAYFQAITEPIEQHGGSVEKYIGDAVLVVFGVPQALTVCPQVTEMLQCLSDSNTIERTQSDKERLS